MNEVALTADNLVIIGEGRILRTGTVADFVREHSRHLLSVVTPDAGKMHAMLAASPTVRITERLMPSENLPAFVFFTLARPVRSMTSSTRPRDTV